MENPVETCEPTSIVGDLMLLPGVGESFGSVGRPLRGAHVGPVASGVPPVSAPVPPVLIAGALVALADFSGNRTLRVGARYGGSELPEMGGAPVELSVELREEETLRTLTARVANRMRPGPEPAPRAPGGTERLPCAVSVYRGEAGASAAPEAGELHLVFGLTGGSGELTVRYAEQMYERSTAGQLADHVLDVLDALLAEPDRPVVEVTRPSWEDAIGQLPGQASDPGPGDLLMPGDLVRSWAVATPDAVALLGADGSALSYRELSALADSLAARLERAGRGGPVAVLASDSEGAALAMVACQFADRCFVMLDPDAPHSRNTALVAAAGCEVLLHDGSSRAYAAALGAATGLYMVARTEAEGTEPAAIRGSRTAGTDGHTAPPAPRAADSSAAYIAFTSGTTGAPKGVVQSRRSFAQFIAWQRDQLGLGPGSRVAMWSAPVFDACYMEVFGALCYGATLCVPPPGERRDPRAVAAWMAASDVTFFQGIPSFIEYLVAALEARGSVLPAVANVIVAGEVFPPALVSRMRAVFPSARLHNMFGPTECVLATRYEIPVGHPANRRVPVGHPITGRRILLMDPRGRPVPRGAVGEIGIVGRFLADGYVGDPALTAERFRPTQGGDDGDSTGGRGADGSENVYHTGDFGRVGPDGTLRYLGRRDAQIKVRGVRVNLDEIEAILSAQPGVSRCKVVDVRVAAGHVQLVALVQPDRRHGPDPVPTAAGHALAAPAQAAAWRTGITRVLGAKAAPTRFIVVREFPTTATGKPDLGRMRRIDDELRTPDPAAGAVTRGGLRERIRSAAATAVGRPVQDDENLAALADNPLLLAVRLKKALMAQCPGVFDAVDVRLHPTVAALEEAVTSLGAPLPADV
ncbi:phenyloxazoline synthase mbtB (plasmid) [Streptomyces clavuligerus]|uniref:Amino acid adenylation domain protein n=2 Tax=Streptomyces clavuligerus TaxID=1901 RepID=D5SIQ6_STRCL|nr:Amino acid adenylation domain protein [Streptomyces clavuligerus]QCS09783.1 phenyloxazoline synthase mbtB [Streptomyces clavuligerus]QPJ98175.1 amino acid adenylation domain-containing protein [Streptomyces clavuligerus]